MLRDLGKKRALGRTSVDALHGSTPERASLKAENEGDEGVEIDEGEGGGSTVEQLTTVASWLAVKEVSITMGTLVQALPFGRDDADVDVLQHAHIEAMGRALLSMMFGTMHNGAIEKVPAITNMVP